MRRLCIPIFLVLLLLAGACSPVQNALIGSGVQSAMDANDAEAELLKAGLCAMGVGAKNRKFSPTERAHIEGLCGGDAKAAIPIEDLRALGAVLQGLGLEAAP